MAQSKIKANKKSTKKKASEKASKKSGVKKRKLLVAVAAAELTQPCLDSVEASFIVGGCLPSGTHNNDKTLEETGLISPDLRLIFRECVFNGVLAAGCDIDKGQIPNDADTTIGEVIQATFENSR